MSMKNYDYLLKLIVVGDGAVGKTALSIRYTDNTFKDDYKLTIGVNFSLKMTNVDGSVAKLQIWDTGGQEQFSYVRPLYYKGCLGGLVVFDKTDRQSFLNIPRWFKEVYDNCGVSIPLILVGNKVDLPNSQVKTKEAISLAKRFNTIYFDASAKTGQQVNTIFTTLTKMIIDPKYVDKLRNVGVEYEQSKIIYKESYEYYNSFANQATVSIQNNNKMKALDNLRKALYWARKAQFEEGSRWCEDQIVYIAQLLNVPTPKEIKGVIFMCQTCNKYYTVGNDGEYVCPNCFTGLIKLSSDSMKV